MAPSYASDLLELHHVVQIEKVAYILNFQLTSIFFGLRNKATTWKIGLIIFFYHAADQMSVKRVFVNSGTAGFFYSISFCLQG